MEDLVAQIDTPRLDLVFITFFYRTNFTTPHLVEFISRTRRFEEPYEADFRFDFDAVEVQLSWPSDDYARLPLEISCEDIGLQFSSMTQACTQYLPPFPTVENLRVFTNYPHFELVEKDAYDVEIETNQWLGLLRPFSAVKSLYISKEFQPSIASTLQELVGGRTTEVLPSLQNIILAEFEPCGHFQEAIGHFLTARQLSGHPIAVFQDDDNGAYKRM